MSFFPMFIKLRDRQCVVIGGGKTAEAKIPGLIEAEARVRVIAPKVTEAISTWAREGCVEWLQQKFESGDLEGAFLVIAATSAADVNQEVFQEAEARGTLCNAVDDPARCHFYYPAVVRRGALQIAISTSGFSPALAQRLRRELEVEFGPEYETWLEWLGLIRSVLRRSGGDPEDTKKILHLLASNEMFERFSKRNANELQKEQGNMA